MKSKNRTGPRLLSSKLLKLCKSELSPILTHLVNLSLEQGIFPEELKLAKVIPVFKAEDSHSFGNYRPISLLLTLSKVFEKVVSFQIINYLNLNDLFYKHQYGFRPKHSTMHPFIKFLEFIFNAHKLNNFVLAVFIDLKKSISHCQS